MYTGTIIKESLKDVSILDRLSLSNERTAKVDNPAPDQPSVWTLYSFSFLDDQASGIAQDLAEALEPGTWYIDMHNDTDCIVVFSNQVFTYKRSDADGRKPATEYGRSLGIPEAQLDWSE